VKLLSFNIRYLDDENQQRTLQISGSSVKPSPTNDRTPLAIGVYRGEIKEGRAVFHHERDATNEELIEALAKLKQLFINCGHTIE
jgi:hypothetical protein